MDQYQGQRDGDEEGINQEIAFVRRRHDSAIKKEAASGSWCSIKIGWCMMTDRDTR